MSYAGTMLRDCVKATALLDSMDQRSSTDYLSNWYLCAKFTVDGKYFTSMEQWIMYSKAMLFKDEVIASKIMRQIQTRHYQTFRS
ncbi:MAG: NADAR family protein [Blautia sp.]